MRIRSIKYKSSTANLLQQTNNQSSPFYSRARFMNSDTSDSQPNINITPIQKKHQGRQLFTQVYLNVKRQEGQLHDIGFENKSQLVMNGIGNRVGIRSEKFPSKVSSLHQEPKTCIQKENRTSIFQGKNKGLIKGLESLSAHQKKSPKVDKIRFRLSKFSNHTQDIRQMNDKNLSSPQNQIPQKDEIILGDNLTYNFQCLQVLIELTQSQLQQIRQQTRKQHNRIQKIRKDLTTFAPKIERQLQRITQQFQKGLNHLQTSMTKAKTQKCSILVNWKSVISEKAKQYESEREVMEEVQICVEKVIRGLEGNEIKCVAIEVEEIDQKE